MKQSIFQLIKSRQSIRTYSKDPIDSTVLDKIQNYIDEVSKITLCFFILLEKIGNLITNQNLELMVL